MKDIKNCGFTLVEALISLAGFIIIMSVVPLMFKVVIVNENIDERKTKLEWLVFMQQLKKEVRVAEAMFIEDEKLGLTIENDYVSYGKYGEKLRRQVNGAGHEVVLQHLQSVQFEEKEGGVTMIYTDVFEQEYRASFYLMKIQQQLNEDEDEDE